MVKAGWIDIPRGSIFRFLWFRCRLCCGGFEGGDPGFERLQVFLSGELGFFQEVFKGFGELSAGLFPFLASFFDDLLGGFAGFVSRQFAFFDEFGEAFFHSFRSDNGCTKSCQKCFFDNIEHSAMRILQFSPGRQIKKREFALNACRVIRGSIAAGIAKRLPVDL